MSTFQPQEAAPGYEAENLNIGLYGDSGVGKTTLAFTVFEDPTNCPGLYLNCDKGGTVVAPEFHAGRVQSYHAVRVDEWRVVCRNIIAGRRMGPVSPEVARQEPPGMHHHLTGKPYATLITDAHSTLQHEEIKGRNLVESLPQDQATAIKSPMIALFGDLREVAQSGCTVVQISHATDRINVKKGPEVSTPAMFPSISKPWMQSVDFLWQMAKSASVAPNGELDWTNPDFEFYFQPIGQRGSAEHCKYIKTRGLAISRMLGNSIFVPTSKGAKFSLAEVISRMRQTDKLVARYLKANVNINDAITRALAEMNKPAQPQKAPAPEAKK